MKPSRTAKMLSNYSRGVLTANEVANALLNDLIQDTELDTTFLASVTELPNDVQESLRNLLGMIKKANYHWRPFRIGTGPYKPYPNQDKRLQLICEILLID
jgi:hypothetical protein